MTRDERLQDAVSKLHRRIYLPRDLLREYEETYSEELFCGMTPRVAHLLAIDSVNRRTTSLRKGGDSV